MKDNLEARLRRIRETDAFLAVRLELLVALAGLITVVGLGSFLWYAIIRRHELWVIATVSVALGIAIGIPIGRFVMPSVIAYVRELHSRMEATRSATAHSGSHPS